MKLQIRIYNFDSRIDQIAVLPGFHANTFPFIACSSHTGIFLVNLNRQHNEKLLKAKIETRSPSKSFFFQKEEFKENCGMTLHLTAHRDIESDPTSEQLNWVKMDLKSDFEQILKKYQTIPKVNIEDWLES